jgi:hypothetical protein
MDDERRLREAEPPAEAADAAPGEGPDAPPGEGADAPPTADAAPAPFASSPIVDWRPSAEPAVPWVAYPLGSRPVIDPGALLRRTLDTFLASWPDFVALTIPAAAASLALLLTLRSREGAGLQLIDLVPLLITLIGVYVTVAVAMAADDARSGRPVSAAAVVGPAIPRSLFAILAAIILVLAVMLVVIAPIVLLGTFVTPGSRPGAAVGLVVGLVFLVFLGVLIYIAFRFSLATMAIAIDRIGPIEGLRRSWRATKGQFWRLGITLLVINLLIAPWSIAGTLFVLGGNAVLGVAVSVVGALAFGALPTILLTLAYGDLTGRAAAPTPAGSTDGAGMPGETDAEAPAPAPPEPAMPAPAVSGTARLAYTVAILVIGCVLVVPAAMAAAANLPNLGVANVAISDRGKIYAGTERNAADPCAPLGRTTSFSTGDDIYIGGYFTRTLLPGQTATLRVEADGTELVAAPLEAGNQAVACYYELDPLNLPAASYRLVIEDDLGLLAEGSFSVE